MSNTEKSESLSFIKSVLSLYDEMTNNGFSLVYLGEFNHQIMKMFTSMAEKSMDKNLEEKSVKKKVFHVMVEILQNMTKHSDNYEELDSGNGLFIVGKKEGSYYIITANKVKEDEIDELKSSIDHINTLDKEQLKELYKKQMKGGSLSQKGGAGLGLIDIARKTGEKLNYQFLPLNDDYFFFLLKVRVSKKIDG